MPVVVTSEAVTQPCAEMWVDPLALGEGFPDTPPDVLERVALDVTWLLWRLTGERFHGAQSLVEDYDLRYGNSCLLDLSKWPVDEVTLVEMVDICDTTLPLTGSGTEVTDWCKERDSIRLCCSGTSAPLSGFDPWYYGSAYGTSMCCSDSQFVRVRYTTKNNLPPGAERAARRLGIEYVKALNGKPCSLPERITTVTRQGATWTVLDPQDFLARGLLGFAAADQWISAANGKGWARIVDPMRAHLLLNSTVVGCE